MITSWPCQAGSTSQIGRRRWGRQRHAASSQSPAPCQEPPRLIVHVIQLKQLHSTHPSLLAPASTSQGTPNLSMAGRLGQAEVQRLSGGGVEPQLQRRCPQAQRKAVSSLTRQLQLHGFFSCCRLLVLRADSAAGHASYLWPPALAATSCWRTRCMLPLPGQCRSSCAAMCGQQARAPAAPGAKPASTETSSRREWGRSRRSAPA